MALEYGPLRERLEAYILDRTANHPALVLWHRDNSIGELFERLYDEGPRAWSGRLSGGVSRERFSDWTIARTGF